MGRCLTFRVMKRAITDEEFRSLINLYLDKEINEDQMEQLKQAINQNREFEKRFLIECRLQRATQEAILRQAAHKKVNGNSNNAASSSDQL